MCQSSMSPLSRDRLQCFHAPLNIWENTRYIQQLPVLHTGLPFLLSKKTMYNPWVLKNKLSSRCATSVSTPCWVVVSLSFLLLFIFDFAVWISDSVSLEDKFTDKQVFISCPLRGSLRAKLCCLSIPFCKQTLNKHKKTLFLWKELTLCATSCLKSYRLVNSSRTRVNKTIDPVYSENQSFCRHILADMIQTTPCIFALRDSVSLTQWDTVDLGGRLWKRTPLIHV